MPSLVDHHLRVRWSGSVSNGPCDREPRKPNDKYEMIPFQTAREIGIVPSLIDHYVFFPSVCPFTVEICRRVGGKKQFDDSLMSLARCHGPLQLVQGLAR